MATAELTGVADGLWSAFRALPRESRERFTAKMVADAATRQEVEDALDLALAQERAGEPTRSLQDVLAEIAR